VEGRPFSFGFRARDGTARLDRENEYHNAQAAATAELVPDNPLCSERNVMSWNSWWATMSNVNSTAAHAGSDRAGDQASAYGRKFLTDFDMFRLTDYYLATCRERAIRIPRATQKHANGRADTASHGCQTASTSSLHNDLLAENYMRLTEACG